MANIGDELPEGVVTHLAWDGRIDGVVDKEALKTHPLAAYTIRDDRISLGTDPEIWVAHDDGTIIPACSFLPDAVKDGRPTTAAIFNDGFQAEFNTSSAECLSYLIDDIQEKLVNLLAAARKVDKTARLIAAPIMEVPEELLIAAKPEHIRMGCMPSKNLYNSRGIEIVNGREVGIRFAGFHIHIGYKNLTEEMAQRAVNAMDALVALPMVALFGKQKSEKLRRDYYGLAGEYRLPKHGLEYRAISARVLHHPIWVHLAFDLARFAFQIGIRRIFEARWETPWEEVKKIVDTSNVKAARGVMTREPLFKEFFGVRYQGKSATVSKLFTGKVKLASGTLEENWKLTPCDWACHSEGVNCNVMKLVLAEV